MSSISIGQGNHREYEWPEDSRPLVIATAGKSGVGKSTMINNFLALEEHEKCPTGDDGDPTTNEVQVKTKMKNHIEVKIVDAPNLDRIKKSDIKKILKDISKKTEEKADILFYCVSLHPSGRINAADANIIKVLTKAYGPEIWSRTILVLTFANERSKVTETWNLDAYRRLIEGYARNFQEALRAENVFGIQVRSVISEENGVPKDTIPAVPIGLDPEEHLLLCENWSRALLHEVLKRANPETIIKLLKLRGYIQPAAEMSGCVIGGIAVGAAVGAAAGAPVGVVPGLVAGIPAGAVAGVLIGLGLHELVPVVQKKYLAKKAEKEDRAALERNT